MADFTIAPGYSSTTYAVPDNSTVAEVPEPMIPGTGGKILAVWYDDTRFWFSADSD